MTITVATQGMSVADIRAKIAGIRSQRGYSYREVSAWNVALDRALAASPELPPQRSPRTCCERARVSYTCTCSYVVQCAEHGTHHHGTHD